MQLLIHLPTADIIIIILSTHIIILISIHITLYIQLQMLQYNLKFFRFYRSALVVSLTFIKYNITRLYT